MAVVRAYLDAWNRHDSAGVCAVVGDRLLPTIGASRQTCQSAVRSALKGVGGPVWIGMRYRIGAVRKYGRSLVSVQVFERHRMRGPHVTHGPRLTDRIWLRRSGKTWKLLKPGTLFYTVSSGTGLLVDPHIPPGSLRLDRPTDVNVQMISTRPHEPLLTPGPGGEDALDETRALRR